ncbi:MAG: histidinol dehydrogenase, partial [Elusimicrobia bacterium]|nr:histidinol dehydrogenase [Elusimicrobiota bacterium]MBD3411906.1 histidinol dehydrogenase [Elusimicrobiota bacterium]
FNKTLSRKVRMQLPAVSIVTVSTAARAARCVNERAPEHVQVMTRNNHAIIEKIKHAGTICVGPYTPVPLADYIAGPSHVLPTGKTARFSSGLSITDFYTKTNSIHYRHATSDHGYAAAIARAEGMNKHTLSLQRRIRR